MASKHLKTGASPVTPTRDLKETTRRALWVLSGGRCEFDACNKYLVRHHVTQTLGWYGEAGHIYAFNESGPRGKAKGRPSDINAVENLILLCGSCHTEIDTNPAKYPVELLKKYKLHHERRVYALTGLADDKQTTILQVKARIGGQVVAMPPSAMLSAVAPRYPENLQAGGHVIDLSTLDVEDPGVYPAACKQIDARLSAIYHDANNGRGVEHLSVFALAPMPLLLYLGTKLSNKIPTDLYQLHRDTSDWRWKEDGPVVAFEVATLRAGKRPDAVALVVSLSGSTVLSALPTQIDDGYTIFEIRPKGVTPSLSLIRRREDLASFRRTYRDAITSITAQHPTASEIAFFPAVAAPVAVACGFDLMPKAQPALVVYDRDKAKGGFTFAMRVNT